MSVSKWAYEPTKCDGQPCVGDCDNCPRAVWFTEEETEGAEDGTR